MEGMHNKKAMSAPSAKGFGNLLIKIFSVQEKQSVVTGFPQVVSAFSNSVTKHFN
jgi:hypothetical protein